MVAVPAGALCAADCIAWWMSVFPGLAIAGTVLSFNVLGDALNDALNPRTRGS